MNYYEYRLHEIQTTLELIGARPDVQDYIEELQKERQEILENIGAYK